MKIYLVEDDSHLNELLVTYLEEAGYEVTSFEEGNSAYLAITEKPDLWVLDIMLPGKDGFELISGIKNATPEIPVIFMSARNSELDRVLGLELGSDDYMPKPFLPRELVLRVKRLLKSRVGHQTQVSGYILDHEQRAVYKDGIPCDLTFKEFEMAKYFIENSNKALSREEILDHVWGKDYFGSPRVIDDTLRRLRKKLESLNIEVVYGYGYILKAVLNE